MCILSGNSDYIIFLGILALLNLEYWPYIELFVIMKGL